MTPQTPDPALDVLLALHAAGNYPFDARLLRDCYEIERQYQYDRGRETAVGKLQQRVDEELAADAARPGAGSEDRGRA